MNRYKLEEICDFYAGTGFPTIYQGNHEGKYPFYKVGDISKNALAGYSELILCNNYIDDDVLKKIKGTIVPPHTVVFAKIGEALKLNRRCLTTSYCLVDNNVMGVFPHQELDYKYFYHFMKTVKMQDYSNATTLPAIKKSEVEKIEIVLPSLPEQQKIAAELDRIQSAIDNKKRQLSLLDEAVKSEFAEMFGENPVESGKWKVEKLETLGSLKNGMNFSPSESGIDLFCVNVSDFQNFYKIEDCKKLSVISLNTLPADDYFLCNEDIVFVRSNGNKKLVGRCIAVYPNNLKVTFSGFCIRFRKEKTEITTDFLLHFLKTDIAREKIKGKGANIQNLNQQILNNVDIPVPPLTLQNQFASFVQQIDKSEFVVKQQITDLQELLDSKMQEYFG